MKISKYKTNKICNLYIENVRKNKKIINCINIIKRFINTEEFYFTLYRVDGINLTENEFLEYSNDIKKYFSNNENIEIFKGKKDSFPKNILSACGKLYITTETIGILPKIFDYFLETTIMIPKTTYEKFNQFFIDNSMSRLELFIEKNICDIAFAYVDSGDFIICFNSEVYEEEYVIETIEKILII